MNQVLERTKGISRNMIENFSGRTHENPIYNVIKDAMMENGIKETILKSSSLIAMNPVFSEEIKAEKIADQKQSGRCWMFAALNTFRHKMNIRFNLKDFELSQNYMMFWDKLEKSNYFLENILRSLDEPLDGRLLSWLLATPQQDGGQWDMLVSLIKKYGVVPKQVMPETFQSSNSDELNSVLNAKLRACALELRTLHESSKDALQLDKLKDQMLSDIYTILVFSLGEPPKTFDFEFRDEKNAFHREMDIKPQAFFEKYVGINIDEYVSIINAPTKDKPYRKTYTVQFLGNVMEGNPIKYLNVDMHTLKQLAIAQIRDHEAVWFGSDVDRYADRKNGILDSNLYDYETAFNTHFSLSKAGRLDYKESNLTHAMILTGVNLVDGEPNRWKVENSWGESFGYKGYFIMSDQWMDEYTYQIVVNKKYLSKELKEALDQRPIELKAWDPMGSLALME